jgi:hypothetical protein
MCRFHKTIDAFFDANNAYCVVPIELAIILQWQSRFVARLSNPSLICMIFIYCLTCSCPEYAGCCYGYGYATFKNISVK